MTRHGYARVSTNDQHPEAQAERLSAYGCSPIWTDKGVSGTKARRPRWNKLLEALEPGDELVCVRLDRIGRSVRNLLDIVTLLQERGVRLVVLDQSIDTGSSMGKLVFHMLAAIAEFERDLIVERTLDGQASVRRAGNLRRSCGGPPVLGFREGDGDDWEREPLAAEWLAEAAERVLAGEPVEAVHRALPEMADATGRAVNVKMLRAALQRPASAGLVPVDDGYAVAKVEAPLDEATFNRLAVLFGSRRRGRPADVETYWLGAKLRCGKCGNQLTGLPGYKARGYYACRNPHKSLGVAVPCRGVSIPAEDVHALVADAVAEWSRTPAARMAAQRSPETGSRRAELEARVAETQEMLADLEAKRLRRLISPARYAELEPVAIAQIEADVAELEALEAEEAAPTANPLGDWDEMSVADRLRVLEMAVALPITVAPGNGGARALTASDRIELVPAA